MCTFLAPLLVKANLFSCITKMSLGHLVFPSSLAFKFPFGKDHNCYNIEETIITFISHLDIKTQYVISGFNFHKGTNKIWR